MKSPDIVAVLDFHQRLPIAYYEKSSTFDLHVGADVHHMDKDGLAGFFKAIQPKKVDFGWEERNGPTGKPCGWYRPHGEGAYNWAYDRWYEARKELMRL